MIAKFIRKEIQYNRIKVERNGEEREKHFLLPQAGNGSKDSKWWSSSIVFYLLT
jgi:hypothetical protein